MKQKKQKVQRVFRSNEKVPYSWKPENLSLEEWQKALRKQFVFDKYFRIDKLDGHKRSHHPKPPKNLCHRLGFGGTASSQK